MIRSTVAHVDLAALQSNFRAIAEFLEGSGGAIDGHAAGGRRPRPPGVIAVVKANAYGHGAARVGARARGRPARRCSRAPTSRKAIVLREAGVTRGDSGVRRARRQRPRRRVRYDADADHLHARRRPSARAGRGGAARRAAALSPEDRHRHEPPRVALRQPGAHAARAARRARTSSSTGVYTHFATADDPGSSAVPDAARALRARARAAAARGCGVRPRAAARRQQRRDAARLARVVRPRAAGPAAVRRRAAAAGVDDSADARSCRCEPRGGREGRAAGRDRRLRRAMDGAPAGPHRGRARRLRRRPRLRLAGAGSCSSAATARPLSARCAWT